jgi:hypothetical protein
MRAATRESTRERKIRIMTSVLVISICFLVPKVAAQSDKYSKMAPVDQYLMEVSSLPESFDPEIGTATSRDSMANLLIAGYRSFPPVGPKR